MNTDSLNIARAILEQLGGGRFAAMTGARTFVALSRGLTFHLPSYMAQHGINFVRVDLQPCDTYRVEFWKLRDRKTSVISTHEGVYCDQLAALFTAQTGLVTTM